MTTEIKLKVAEAIQDDVNKGIIRIDSSFMREIGIRPGDIVEIVGGRSSVAIVDRAYPGDIGLNIVRMDGLIRKNVKTSIGETVNVRKVKVEPAKKITIAPAREGIIVQASPAVFKQGLLGRAVVKGDIIGLGGARRRRTTMTDSPLFDEVFSMMEERMGTFGFGDLKFLVIDAQPPKTPVIITEQTEIVLNPEAVEIQEDGVPEVTYEDIGGLSEEVKKVREMIELPLKHPEIFQRLGIEPPKGVLLHGPPGTGKTLLARAVASETNAHFISINGPEIMSKYYGQSLPAEEKILSIQDGSIKRLPIGDIVDNNLKLKVACFDKDGKTAWKDVVGWIKHPRRSKLVEIKTRTGRKITVTEDHSLFTLTKKGIESTATSALTAGKSFIAVPKKLPEPINPVYEINLLEILSENDKLCVKNPKSYLQESISIIGRKSTAEILGVSEKYLYDITSKDVGISVNKFIALMKKSNITLNPSEIQIGTKGKGTSALLKITPSLCRFFGWWMAEGSYTNKDEARLSINSKEADSLISLCTKLFNKVLVYRKNKNSCDLYICSAALGRIMQALGFNSGASSKKLPEFIYNLDNKNLAEFLRGYISGDGSVNRTTPAPQVEICTESPLLADDICYSLLRFGIVAKVYDRKNRTQKRICFADAENLKQFLEIGFEDPLRNQYIAQHISKNPDSRRERLPIDAVEGIDTAWKDSESIGVNALLKQQTMPAELIPALAGDIFWDKVIEIKEALTQPEFVYDISVEPCQNFISGFGGIFAHNSEENLRKKFEEAEKNSPSIIFIDEIDAIASKREETRGEVEKRVVAQLLSLMDGLKTRGKVVVIAATNVPNTIDPALRRPGRFDRELEIGAPNVEGRLNILKIHTRNMPLNKDVKLEEIAEVTHGFVGADVASLCKEAAMIVLRQLLPDLKYEKEGSIPQEILDQLIVKKKHFFDALKTVRPSALREVFIDVPTIKWEDIGGLENVKQDIKEAVEWPLKYPDAFKRLGVRAPKGILLYGPPGTGKTMLAKAVANESKANFISIKGPELLSKWVGESEKAVRAIFKKARQTAPTIIFFDEIDSIAPRRNAASENQVAERVVNQLLTEIDGLETMHDVVIIGATNRPDIIDTALLRPGRFDRIVLCTAPDAKSRKEIFKVHTANMPLDNVNLDALSEQSEGYAGADIEAVCREAAMLSLREDIKSKKVTMEHFEKALKTVRPSITPDIEKSYAELKDEFSTARAKQMKEEKPAYFG